MYMKIYDVTDVPLRCERDANWNIVDNRRGSDGWFPVANFVQPPSSCPTPEPAEKLICKKWFLDFSYYICSRFPREIRNLVYDYLVPDGKAEGRRYEHEVALANIERQLVRDFRYPLYAPYYLQPYFVDTQMSKEMDERFCKKVLADTKFKICGVECLKEVLCGGYPSTACLLCEHLRSLHLAVRPPYWDFETFPPEISAKYEKTLLEDTSTLESLLELKHHRGFELKITACFKAECDWPNHKRNTKFNRWLEAMLSLLHRLDKEGFEIEIFQAAIITRKNAKSLITSRGSITRSITADSLFRDSPEQWLDSIKDATIFELQQRPLVKSSHDRVEMALDEAYGTPGIDGYEQVPAQPRRKDTGSLRLLHGEYCEECLPYLFQGREETNVAFRVS